MPCYDGRGCEDSASDAAELARVTELLCEAGRAYMGKRPPSRELLTWWQQHSQRDNSRGEPWEIAP